MNTYSDKISRDNITSSAASLSNEPVTKTSGTYLLDNRPQSGVPPKHEVNPNQTGLPDQLKTGIENLSGESMDDVKVHYHSAQPALLNAHAFAKGTAIHLATGQEKHLPHEAWHVVQQKQGRVKPTLQMKGKVAINDDKGLEQEATTMGNMALSDKSLQQPRSRAAGRNTTATPITSGITQRMIGSGGWVNHGKKVIRKDQKRYQITGFHFFAGILEYRITNDGGDVLFVKFNDDNYNIFDFQISPLGSDPDEETEKWLAQDPLEPALTMEVEQDLTGPEKYHVSTSNIIEKEEEMPSDPVKIYTSKTWKLDELVKRLKESTPLDPLDENELTDITKSFESLRRQISRKLSGEIAGLIKIAGGHIKDFFVQIYSTRPTASKKRTVNKGGEPLRKISKANDTFNNGSVSELSDEEYDADKRLKKYPVTMSGIVNRSHVIGIDDEAEYRYLISGLPHLDTYLALFKDGLLVPRNINGKSNSEALRKRMRDVEKRIAPLLMERDKLFIQRDNLNRKISSKKYKGKVLGQLKINRDDVYHQLQRLLTDDVRPHLESILFGSSSAIRPTDEDISVTEDAAKERENIKRNLILNKDLSVSGELMQKYPPVKVDKGVGSGTHAEQTLINTRTWGNLIKRLVAAIASSKDKPGAIALKSFTTLQLVINRSTCVGCARELTLELIRFWQEVAIALDITEWRQAKVMFEEYVHFLIDFPVIYENSQEKATDYVNLQRIILGLRDAGWKVNVITGIEKGDNSNATNTEARRRVSNLATTPMVYARGWNLRINRFKVPETLTELIKGKNMLLVNGIIYSLIENQFVRDAGVKGPADQVDKFKFEITGHSNSFKRGKPSGSPDGSGSDSSSSGYSSDDSMHDDEQGYGFDEQEEIYDEDNEQFDTGRIQHAQNSCYLAVLVHLFASHDHLADLFHPNRHTVNLENDQAQALALRVESQERGLAIQMNSGIRQAIHELRDPYGLVTEIEMSNVMKFLGLVGNIIPEPDGVSRTKVIKPETLESRAMSISKSILQSDSKDRSKGDSFSSKKRHRPTQAEPLAVDLSKGSPKSWGVQQDAAEILTGILQHLRPGLNLTIKERSTLRSPLLPGASQTLPAINEHTLQLPIQGNIASITDALTNYSAVEDNVDYQGMVVSKQIQFSALPSVLIIVLKRFAINQHNQAPVKITKEVAADAELTIPQVCLTGALSGQIIRYRLIHFTQHRGGYGGGHYVSHVKNEENQWYEHDDMKGRTIPTQQKLLHDLNTSYIYTYERMV